MEHENIQRHADQKADSGKRVVYVGPRRVRSARQTPSSRRSEHNNSGILFRRQQQQLNHLDLTKREPGAVRA